MVSGTRGQLALGRARASLQVRMARSQLVMALALVILCLGAVPISVPEKLAAPEIVIFADDRLARRIAIAGWEPNHRWLAQTVLLRPDQRPLSSELAQRSSITIALFWGAHWRAYTHPESLRVLAPERANQHGRFYPAVGSRGAVVDIGTLRGISDSGVALLRAHGVPVRVQRPR